MFYKTVDGKIEKCPKNGVLKDGRAISNMELFFEKNEEVAKENGYVKGKDE